MKFIYTTLAQLIIFSIVLTAQNPKAHNLFTSDYIFDGFIDPTTTTYPESMVGLFGPRQAALYPAEVGVDGQAIGAAILTEYPAEGGILSDDAVRNEVEDGIQLRIISSSEEGPMGFVVAIDTRGCKKVLVVWSAEISVLSSTSPNRGAFQLQFRDGISGDWTSVAGSKFSGTDNPTNKITLEDTLPAEAENVANLQLRWLYYSEADETASGRRDGLCLDDIIIQATEKDESQAGPLATFTSAKGTGGQVTFTNTSQNGPFTSTLWSFGDENTSTEDSPVHQYAQNGVYTVKMVVENSVGKDSTTEELIISDIVSSIDEIGTSFNMHYSPEQSSIIFMNPTEGNLSVYSINGQLIETKDVNGSTEMVSLHLTGGTYVARFSNNEGEIIRAQKFRVQH